MSGTSPGEGSTQLTKWIEQVRGGDRDAFAHLCNTSSVQRVVLAIAASLPDYLRARVDPEDILQEVLNEAWRGIGDLRNASTRGFHRWLAGIARHRVADVIRRHNQPKRAVGRDRSLGLANDARAGLPDSHTPSRSVARREQLARIIEILNLLPERYRDVVRYRILEGYTPKETAGLLKTTPENVAILLHRALVKLGKLVNEHGIESTLFRPL